MSDNLALVLTGTAGARGPGPALRFDGGVLSYDELDAWTARMAALLRDWGVPPSGRIGIMLPNVAQFAIVYYGVLRAGAVVVPMNVLLKQREVAYHLSDSGATHLFAWHTVAEQAAQGAAQAGTKCVVVAPGELESLLETVEPETEVVPRTNDDTAVVLYTSGTTGEPKGAELTHANLRRNAEAIAGLVSMGPDDIVLGALPLFHAFGQTCGLNAAVTCGASLALVAQFDPGVVLETIARERVTLFEGVPTMYVALLRHAERDRYDVSTLRLALSGGASMPVEVLHEFERILQCKVLEGYGLSETSPVASFNRPDRERKAGSIGTPIEGVQMRLTDDARNEVAPDEVGEIAIRGHNVMKGYWNRPHATQEAVDAEGWFYSGDLARVDEDGYFFIVDRKKDMIIRGGYNVYPREIEEVLYEHPAVEEAAVIGVAHAELGEEVAAAVKLRRGADVTAEQLRDHVKSQVAAYKYPRHLWIVDELPKGPTGKILKREITPTLAVAPTAE
jgi:long-chain acyl-CoA synthetase